MQVYTAYEGPVRIQYKCLVPIYVFPEMKLCSLLISKAESECSVSQFLHLYTVKRPKFGNGPYFRHLFSDDIFPVIKVVDTVSKSKRLLLLSSSLVEFCGEELKCHLLICISFVLQNSVEVRLG